MRVVSIILLTLATILSCNKKADKKNIESKAKESITTYMNTKMSKLNVGAIDSITILKIDTITEQKKYLLLSEILDKEVDNRMAKLKKLKDIINDTKTLYELTGDYISKEEYENKNSKFNKEINLIKEKLDSSKIFVEKSKKADSIKFISYGVGGTCYYTTPEHAAKEAVFYHLLNSDFKIIEISDFVKKQ